MACCKPNWIFTQKFPFRLQQAYKVRQCQVLICGKYHDTTKYSLKDEKDAKNFIFWVGCLGFVRFGLQQAYITKLEMKKEHAKNRH